MDRYQDSFLGLWMLGAGYGAHYLLYPYWKNRTLVRWLRWPLCVLAWLSMIGLLLPLKDFVVAAEKFIEHPTAGAAFEVGGFACLALALGWFYQNAQYLAYDRIKPFMANSMFLRHSVRVSEDIFAQAEQKEIDLLSGSAAGRSRIHGSPQKKRPAIDREQEVRDLEQIRRERTMHAGEAEEALLRKGIRSDLTDLLKLFNPGREPHPLLVRTFMLVIDPDSKRCILSVVFPDVVIPRIKKPEQWFRFRQDLFDAAQSLTTEEWMLRFRGTYEEVEITCFQEVSDSFGLPQRTAFLSVAIPVQVLDEYREKMFIATELERVATITWIEGAAS